MGRRLFIIGNGFDLGHDLPTKYTDFYNYLHETSEGTAFVNNIEKVVSCHPNQLWNDFEKKLGNITDIYLMEEAMHERHEHNNQFDYDPLDESFITDFIIEKHLASLYKLDYFVSEWIKTVDVREAMAKESYQNVFKGKASYITFNYTETLQKVYGIEENNIHHVHGDIDDPIMGHGMDKSEEIFKLNSSFGEDFVLEEFTNNISSQLQGFYEGSRKDTPLFIENIGHFIDGVEHEIQDVHVIGHSLGEVDQLYFQALMNTFSNAQWILTYFNEDDKYYKQSSLSKMKVKGKIELVLLDDYLQS